MQRIGGTPGEPGRIEGSQSAGAVLAGKYPGVATNIVSGFENGFGAMIETLIRTTLA